MIRFCKPDEFILFLLPDFVILLARLGLRSTIEIAEIEKAPEANAESKAFLKSAILAPYNCKLFTFVVN